MPTFKSLIERCNATVGVLGQGYVGLPLSIAIAKAGFNTFGMDIDSSRVASLNEGRSHITDVSDRELLSMRREGRYRATDDFSNIARADVIVICVPTPLRKSKDPDISYIMNATESIKQHVRPPVLIVLESTTYPGTTEELIVTEMESLGLELDKDFFACFSPERVDPGNQVYKTENIPKIVGGVSPLSTELGTLFYSQVMDQVRPVSSARVAEMAKLLENTFRAVNIGLINELSLMAERMEVDIWEVIDAAATKPFGFMPFHPGPGIGGHCIPFDPMFLSWKGKAYDFFSRFIELASEINAGMPAHTVQSIIELLNMEGLALSRSRILLLGLAYKKNVSDTRESPALEIARLLKNRGAEVSAYDPYVGELPEDFARLILLPSLDEGLLTQFDCVILTTDHDDFDYPWLAKHSNLIYDTRNAFKKIEGHNIHRLGAPRTTALHSSTKM